MPGPKMGPRPVDFDETMIRQSPTFAKWVSLAEGQKLRYACRDFIKGYGNDEERLMRRIMIARRNNLRDHETLKQARRTVAAATGVVESIATPPPVATAAATAEAVAATAPATDGGLELAAAAAAAAAVVAGAAPAPDVPVEAADLSASTAVAAAAAVTLKQEDVETQSLPVGEDPNAMELAVDSPPNIATTEASVPAAAPAPNTLLVHHQEHHAHHVQHQHSLATSSNYQTQNMRRRRTPASMSDQQVEQEMDVPAVVLTRSYKAWMALPPGTEFVYNQKYIKGKDGHDWLLRKNIWRRMRYRRENKRMMEQLKNTGQLERGNASNNNNGNNSNAGAPSIQQNLTMDGRGGVLPNPAGVADPVAAAVVANTAVLVDNLLTAAPEHHLPPPMQADGTSDAVHHVNSVPHQPQQQHEEATKTAVAAAAAAAVVHYDLDAAVAAAADAAAADFHYSLIHNPLNDAAALEAAAKLAIVTTTGTTEAAAATAEIPGQANNTEEQLRDENLDKVTESIV